MPLQKKRILWIDICRLISMVLVVWLHFGAPGVLNNYIHLFHMPIFFMLSGLCLNTNKKPAMLIYSKFKSLIIPYFSFGVLFYIIWSLIYLVIMPDRITSFNDFLYILLWNNTAPKPYLWGGVQWFLPCLFFAEMIFYCIFSALKNKYTALGCITLLGIVYIYVFRSRPFFLPMGLDVSLIAVFFIALGHCLKERIVIVDRLTNIHLQLFAALLFAISLICHFVNGTTNMRLMEYNNPFLYLIGSTSGCLVLIILSKLITKNISSWRYFSKLLYLGKNTIILLYIHRLFDGLEKTVLDLLNIGFESKMIKYLYFGLMTMLFFAISYPLTKFVDKNCSLLLGRWNNRR